MDASFFIFKHIFTIDTFVTTLWRKNVHILTLVKKFIGLVD